MTWMDLEDIMLIEKGQTEKDKYHVISFTCAIQKQLPFPKINLKLIDTENRLVVARGRGGCMGEMDEEDQEKKKSMKILVLKIQ